MASGGQFALQVVDGEVFRAECDGESADAVASGSRLRPASGQAEEGGALGGVVAGLMAKDAEGVGGVGETAGERKKPAAADSVMPFSVLIDMSTWCYKNINTSIRFGACRR